MNSVTVDGVYDHDADPEEMLRLPGEEGDPAVADEILGGMPPEAPEGLFADPNAAMRPRATRPGSARLPAGRKHGRSNSLLYSCVGMVALLLAGGYFVLRPDITHFPARGTAVRLSGIPPMPVAPPAQVAHAPVAPLAPAASLANVPVPPMPTAVIHKKYVPLPFAYELAELEHLRAGLQMPIADKTAPQGPALGGEMSSQPKAAQQISTDKQAQPGTGVAEPGHIAAAAPLAVDVAVAQRPQAAASSPPVIQTSASATAARLRSSVPAAPTPAAFAPAAPGSPIVATTAPAENAVPQVIIASAAAPGGKATLPAKSEAGAAGNPAVSRIGVMPGTAIAAALAAAQAGTMSPGQQTQLYQLVTEVGILERDDRIRVSVLTGDVQQLTALTTGKLADFERRLSMLEAQTAVSGAEQAGATMPVVAAMAARPAATPANAAPQALPATPPTLTAPPAARAASSASAPPAAVSAALPPSGLAAPVQYQVQAASPGLAMLSVIGGDGSPMEVQTGDIIQGYGKVLGVVQQGNAWVVETASGNIE